LAEVIDATPEDENDFKKPIAEITCDADITCINLNFYHAGKVEVDARFFPDYHRRSCHYPDW
jgi:hypothetical protein